MRLFLDTSVLLAACGRPDGASGYVIERSTANHWELVTSPYVIHETEKNLTRRFSPPAQATWGQIKPKLIQVPDVLTFLWPTVFHAGKDRPVLYTAYAFADILLTLDHHDFSPLMESGFYGLAILTPGSFLKQERAAGRLVPPQ